MIKISFLGLPMMAEEGEGLGVLNPDFRPCVGDSDHRYLLSSAFVHNSDDSELFDSLDVYEQRKKAASSVSEASNSSWHKLAASPSKCQ